MRIASLYGDPPVFSLEFFTPKTDKGRDALYRATERLMAIEPAFVSVTCGAAGSTRERTADLAIALQDRFELTVMPHVVCTGTTQQELAETLSFMTERGIDNVLALRGDPPRGEPNWQPVEGGFRYANELAAFVRDNFALGIGGACYPEKHPEATDVETDIENLKKKTEAGAEFLITQVFFDNDVYWRFVDRVRDAGIEVPIVPGIMPIVSSQNLERIIELSPGTSVPSQLRNALGEAASGEDALAIGVGHATKQCNLLLENGAPGVHFYTLNKSRATLKVHAQLARR